MENKTTVLIYNRSKKHLELIIENKTLLLKNFIVGRDTEVQGEIYIRQLSKQEKVDIIKNLMETL